MTECLGCGEIGMVLTDRRDAADAGDVSEAWECVLCRRVFLANEFEYEEVE